jgi:probable addiction module antidote protein
MSLYLEACFAEAGDDAAFIAKALGDIAKARSMSQLAKDTGLGRESLYKALSGEGNPSFATILKVINACKCGFNHCFYASGPILAIIQLSNRLLDKGTLRVSFFNRHRI